MSGGPRLLRGHASIRLRISFDIGRHRGGNYGLACSDLMRAVENAENVIVWQARASRNRYWLAHDPSAADNGLGEHDSRMDFLAVGEKR